MKILLVHQYFKTPEAGSGIRTWYLARSFAIAGHEVEVISGHDQQNETISFDGFRVHYHRIPYANRYGLVRRLWSFWRFVYACKKHLKDRHDYDLLYVLTTPLSTGLIALHAKRKYSIPYGFEVGDLWPMAPIQMGYVPWNWLQDRLYRFEEKVYKEAKYLIGLSQEIAKVMEYVVDYNKEVIVIPNMADCGFFKTAANIPGAFTTETPLVISYFGALGKANHLEYLIELGKVIEREELPISVKVMGDGGARQSLMAKAESISAIIWMEWGNKEHVRELLDLSHAVYVSYANIPVLETGSPNKLFDGLAAGKLIILNFGGWIKALVENNECGFSYEASQPEMCLELLKPFLLSPFLLTEYQKNARRLAEEQFEVGLLTNKAIDYIAE